MKKSGVNILLTVKETLDLLPPGKEIHTFRNSSFMLIGADWSRKKLEKYISDSKERQIGGDMCMGMGHGLVIIPKEAKTMGDALFVSHDKAKMKKFL